jgi:5-methylcytosine-specific restriction enzyme subunit McrC
LLLRGERQVHVLDTKWKLLEEQLCTTEHKYRINQADLYQLFAYGQKYQGGEGDMMLIYPKHPGFLAPLPPFHFDDRLRLWAVPFDLEDGKLVRSDWSINCPALWTNKPLEHTDAVNQTAATAPG